jgi:hypothetical protein
MFNTYLGMPYSCILAAFGNRGCEVVILTGWVEDVETPKRTCDGDLVLGWWPLGSSYAPG